jgi:hypothetical protein
MTVQQLAFFRQAASDWEVFLYLRQATPAGTRRWSIGTAGIRIPRLPVCHELHYLQMCTEKLAKAYFDDSRPKSSHAVFRNMFKSLRTNSRAILPLNFPSVVEFVQWIVAVQPIVDGLEDLAPSIADKLSRANPEYPYPKDDPINAPADHTFVAEMYAHLVAHEHSGQPFFLTVLDRMLGTMRADAWHL